MIGSESLEGLACSAAAQGEAERAAKLFGAAEALREAVGYQQAPRERALREPYLAAAYFRVGEADWESMGGGAFHGVRGCRLLRAGGNTNG